MQVNDITVHYIVLIQIKKQNTKILAEMTNKKDSKKQTKISHYLELGQNSRFYWVLKKLSLQIKGNSKS